MVQEKQQEAEPQQAQSSSLQPGSTLTELEDLLHFPWGSMQCNTPENDNTNCHEHSHLLFLESSHGRLASSAPVIPAGHLYAHPPAGNCLSLFPSSFAHTPVDFLNPFADCGHPPESGHPPNCGPAAVNCELFPDCIHSTTCGSKKCDTFPACGHSADCGTAANKCETFPDCNHPSLCGPVKRKKTSRACLACRKSHLSCDESRPCKRCVKKGIECVERPDHSKIFPVKVVALPPLNEGAVVKPSSACHEVEYPANPTTASNAQMHAALSALNSIPDLKSVVGELEDKIRDKSPGITQLINILKKTAENASGAPGIAVKP